MNSRLFTLVLFLGIILVVIWVNKPSGHEQRLNKIIAGYEYKIAQYKDTLRSERLEALNVFSDYVKKLDRMEGDRNYWKRKAKECE